MTKNFDREIKESDGSIYLEPRATGKFTSDGKPLFEAQDGIAIMYPVKFGTTIGNLLRNNMKKDHLSSDEHIEQWNMQKKIAAGGDIEFTGEQINLMRELIVKSKISPFIIGQICEYLNEKEKSAVNSEETKDGK